MKRVYDFLKKAGVYYLATVEGDQPRVRPFGTANIFEGKLYIQTGKVKPTYRPGVRWCNLWDVLPEFICKSLEEALPLLERKLKGFSAPDAVLTAVESRSSCPLRILRGEDGQSELRGLFPCGEGAGYAGGITSAAVDGVRCAEAVIERYR